MAMPPIALLQGIGTALPDPMRSVLRIRIAVCTRLSGSTWRAIMATLVAARR
jgi:hypothetical protein